MGKNNNDNMKIHGISAPRVTTSVEQLSNVSEVEKAQKTTAVGAVRGVSGVSKAGATKSIDSIDREVINRMLHEEADKLFGKNGKNSVTREIAETAVRMALDSATLQEVDKQKK
jgi:hypothetical protein